MTQAATAHDVLLAHGFEPLISITLAPSAPHRLGIQAMRRAPRAESALPLLSRLNDVCDPAGLLAPGRYGLTTSTTIHREMPTTSPCRANE